MFKITFIALLHAAVILTADIACEQRGSERNIADVMILFFIVCLWSFCIHHACADAVLPQRICRECLLTYSSAISEFVAIRAVDLVTILMRAHPEKFSAWPLPFMPRDAIV